jgi:Tfp pilus assembly protein PilE
MKSKQRGITFLGLLIGGVVVALGALVVAQVAPTYLEYQSILKAAQRAAGAGNTVAEIRRAFDASAAVEYFTAIKSGDLEISKENDKVVVSFAYDKEIHLVGPAYLVMKYKGRTQ